MPANQLYPNTIKRFYSKIKITSTCWIWLAGKSKEGYGKFGIRPSEALRLSCGKAIRAHRLSFCLSNSTTLLDIQNKLILHSCDNPSCVNPNHLRIGTDLENAQDRVRRKRGWNQHGENGPRAKLTKEQVLYIRKMKNKCPQKQLALELRISVPSISMIQNNKAWRNTNGT